MFSKKNKETAKKIVVNHDTEERPIGIKVEVKREKLVSVEMHEHRVNGQVQAPEFRISVANHDVITLNERQYDALFMEMLRHKDADEIIAAISHAHMEEYHSPKVADAFEMKLPKEVVEILEKMSEEADKATNG